MRYEVMNVDVGTSYDDLPDISVTIKLSPITHNDVKRLMPFMNANSRWARSTVDSWLWDFLTGGDSSPRPEIKKVIFNNPATIVFWEDGAKTVVKCQDEDIYDPHAGIAFCYMKKVLGNQGNFNNVFRKWVPQEECDRFMARCFTISPYSTCKYCSCSLGEEPCLSCECRGEDGMSNYTKA